MPQALPSLRHFTNGSAENLGTRLSDGHWSTIAEPAIACRNHRRSFSRAARITTEFLPSSAPFGGPCFQLSSLIPSAPLSETGTTRLRDYGTTGPQDHRTTDPIHMNPSRTPNSDLRPLGHPSSYTWLGISAFTFHPSSLPPNSDLRSPISGPSVNYTWLVISAFTFHPSSLPPNSDLRTPISDPSVTHPATPG
jgi:hypothetical protein